MEKQFLTQKSFLPNVDLGMEQELYILRRKKHFFGRLLKIMTSVGRCSWVWNIRINLMGDELGKQIQLS